MAAAVDHVWTSSTGGEIAVWEAPSDLQITCTERLAEGAGGRVECMAMSFHRMLSCTGAELLVWDELRREGVQELRPPSDREVLSVAPLERIGRIVGLCPDGLVEWIHRANLGSAEAARKVSTVSPRGHTPAPVAPPLPPPRKRV